MLGAGFDEPSAKGASTLIGTWGQDLPLVVVATPDEESLIKSFRNLSKVLVTVPGELEVSELVWARSLLISEAALELVQAKAGVA